MFAKWLLDQCCCGINVPKDEGTESDATRSGAEWLLVEDIRGWWFHPYQGFFSEYVVVDQTMCAIYYRNASKIMDLKDISCVIPVHEIAASSGTPWKVYLQDTEQFQEWVISFPTQDRLLRWVDHLKKVLDETDSSAIVHELVLMEDSTEKESLKQVQVNKPDLPQVAVVPPTSPTITSA